MDEHICGSHRVHKVIADKAAWAIPDEAVRLRYNAASGHDTVGYIASLRVLKQARHMNSRRDSKTISYHAAEHVME